MIFSSLSHFLPLLCNAGDSKVRFKVNLFQKRIIKDSRNVLQLESEHSTGENKLLESFNRNTVIGFSFYKKAVILSESGY